MEYPTSLIARRILQNPEKTLRSHDAKEVLWSSSKKYRRLTAKIPPSFFPYGLSAKTEFDMGRTDVSLHTGPRAGLNGHRSGILCMKIVRNFSGELGQPHEPFLRPIIYYHAARPSTVPWVLGGKGPNTDLVQVPTETFSIGGK